ncbi:MAG TPA: DUF4189 domain-containing protein [Nevskiaceae bacterium]|nr:DUF4189 domain-containing protein [Nevskiaceae bacterium]
MRGYVAGAALIALAWSITAGAVGPGGGGVPAERGRADPTAEDRAQAAGIGPLFGAIAADPGNGAYGYSWDYPTRAEAQARAFDECQAASPLDGCRDIAWVKNGCAAVAVRSTANTSLRRIAWGIGSTALAARKAALAECASDGSCCRVLAWTCTSNAGATADAPKASRGVLTTAGGWEADAEGAACPLSPDR